MKKISLLLSTLVLLFSVAIISCDKNENTEDNNPSLTLLSAEDEVLEDILWNTIDADVDYVGGLMDLKSYKSVLDTCPMIIVEHPDSAYFPRTVIIDYGEDYCETFHGRAKKGKIIIHITRPIYEEGSIRTVTFENYFIAEHQIEGVKTLINKGINDSGNMNFDVTLADGKVTFPDQTEATREMVHNREWITGMDTPRYWWDNEWLSRGTAQGMHRDGKAYENTILEPVLVKAVCRFPVSGTIEILISDLPYPVLLNYGDGACDNLATLTFGDQVWEIELGKHQ